MTGATERTLRERLADALWNADEGYGWDMTTEAREDYLGRADLLRDTLVAEGLTVTELLTDERRDHPGDSDGVPPIDWWERHRKPTEF